MRHEQIKRAKRSFSVRGALEWAFGTEHAQLNFDATDAEHRSGLSMEALLMERAILGAQVDTSRGRSFPADDAEIIASFVSALPVHQAVKVAEYARAGTTPNPMIGVVPKLKPIDWQGNQHGWRGKTAASDWEYSRFGRKGNLIREFARYTPCEWEPTAAQIAQARRAYLDWWGALLHLGYRFSLPGVLSIEIRNEMPKMTPWKNP